MYAHKHFFSLKSVAVFLYSCFLPVSRCFRLWLLLSLFLSLYLSLFYPSQYVCRSPSFQSGVCVYFFVGKFRWSPWIVVALVWTSSFICRCPFCFRVLSRLVILFGRILSAFSSVSLFFLLLFRVCILYFCCCCCRCRSYCCLISLPAWPALNISSSTISYSSFSHSSHSLYD